MLTYFKRPCAMTVLCLGIVTVACHAQAPATDLLAGSSWQYSIDGGATYTDKAPDIHPGETAAIIAKRQFTLKDPTAYIAYAFTHNRTVLDGVAFSLNGKKLAGPLPGMFYQTIPAIGPEMFKTGENVITAAVKIKNYRKAAAPSTDITFSIDASLAGLTAADLKVQSGPVLCAVTDNSFAITLRTNMPSMAKLKVAPSPVNANDALTKAMAVKEFSSGPALIHRVLVDGLASGTEYSCLWALTPAAGGAAVIVPTVDVRTTAPGKLVFAALGDSRTNPDKWAQIAQMVLKAKPAFFIHNGDMVTNGLNDRQWDDEFFTRTPELFRNVPIYTVMGNHEHDCPLYYEMFRMPGGDGRMHNWQQIVGDVLLVGIDGAQDWSAAGENAKWLDGVLGASKAKFIFLISHYPTWSSSLRGEADEHGPSKDATARQGREVIMPILARHKVTAMLVGHNHGYERSEIKDGVTQITCAGAGAPLYEKSPDAAIQNPYSAVFASKMHYCLFTIEGDRCTMEVTGLDGEKIDSRAWTARTASP